MTNELFRDLLDGKIPAPVPAARRVVTRPLYIDEFHEWTVIQDFAVEPWQFAIFDQRSIAKVLPYTGRYRFDRCKPDDRIQAFSWEQPRQPAPPVKENLPSASMRLGMWPSAQAPPADPRQQALAAKAAQGKGPPSSASWRGRERTTKFRSQS